MSQLDLNEFVAQAKLDVDSGIHSGPDLHITPRVDAETAMRRLPPLPALLAGLMRQLRDVDAAPLRATR